MPPRRRSSVAVQRKTTRRPSAEEASPSPPDEERRRAAVELDTSHVKEIKHVAMVRAIYSEARKKKDKAGIDKLSLKQAFQLVKDGSRAMVLSKGIASLISVAKEQRQQEESDAANFEEEVEELKRAMAAGEHFEEMRGSLISIVEKAFGGKFEGVAMQFREAMYQVSDSLSSLTEKLNLAKRDNDEVLAFLASIQGSFSTIGVDVQKILADVHKANVALGHGPPDSTNAKKAGTPTPENSDVSDDSSDDASEVIGVEETGEDPKQAVGLRTSPKKRKKDIMKTIKHSKLLSHQSVFTESKKQATCHVTESLMEILGDIVQQKVTQEIQEQVIEADIGEVVEIMAGRWRTARNKIRMTTMLNAKGNKSGLSELVAASTVALAPMAPEEDRPLTDRPISKAPPAGWTAGHRGQQFHHDHAGRQTGGFEHTWSLRDARGTTPKVDRWTEVKKQAVSARGIESVMVDRSQRKGLIRGLGLRPLGVQRPPFPMTQAWQSEGNSTLLTFLSRHSSRFEIDGIQALAKNAGTSAPEELTAYRLSHKALSHLDVPARQRWTKLPQLQSALQPDDLVKER